MEYVALGKSNLLVSRTAFGAMSLDCSEIECLNQDADEKVCALVHQAYNGGINFFDISHSKLLCEKRLGSALMGLRHNVFLATKTTAQDVHTLRNDLNESLMALQSDYIDLYQIENPNIVPLPKDKSGLYDELLHLKSKGLIRHIGLASENLDLAKEAILSGAYETVQFPFNVISTDEHLELVKLCEENDVGCIAMQPLNGGIITNLPLAYGFLHQYENVVPVWGIHTQEELHQLLYFNDHVPVVDNQFLEEVDNIRQFFN